MRYVAFLRGINVGGNSIVSMAALKEIFEGLGLDDVRTYINSGNVIFSSGASDADALTGRIEKAIQKGTGKAIKVLVLSRAALKKIVDAIPAAWVNGPEMRCDVMLLWKEVDSPKTVEQLPVNPAIEDVKYTPGALIWRIDRKNVTKSKIPKIIGTPFYRQTSARNVNTMRKLNELT